MSYSVCLLRGKRRYVDNRIRILIQDDFGRFARLDIDETKSTGLRDFLELKEGIVC